MPASSRIQGPVSVELGKIGTAKISVICWNVTGNTQLRYGIGYKVPGVGRGKSTWHGWKNYSSSVPCDQPFEFAFEVTQDMWDKQKAGNALFVYSCDSSANRPISGVCNGRYSYFAVTKPGVTPIGGRIYVAMSISGLHSTGKTVVRLYADEYKESRIYRRAKEYGSTYARPDGKVFREGLAGFWKYVKFMRMSLFCSLYEDEQDWLLRAGVMIVPDDWNPGEGAVSSNFEPTCDVIAKFMSRPVRIPETWRTWDEYRSEQTTAERLSMVVPPDVLNALSFDLSIRMANCRTMCGQVQIKTWEDVWREQRDLEDRTAKWIYTAPVTFSVNDIDVGTMYPSKRPYPLPDMVWSGIKIDLLESQTLWSHILPNVDSVTVKARSPETLLNGFKIPALYAETIIPVWRPDAEPTPTPTPPEPTPTPPEPTPTPTPPEPTPTPTPPEPTPTPPEPTPTPPEPTPTPPEDRRRPVACRDGSVVYQEIFIDGAWIPSGETCPEDIAKRTMMAAVPKIMYEGQAVNIVVGAYIGAAPSTDETAILTIDNTEVARMNTLSGEVTFRWIAEGVGMHDLCITIPANENSPTPGSVCKIIMVSADVGSIKEQIRIEMEAYNYELELLRKKKWLSRETMKRYVPPGFIVVPKTFAGELVDIGGVTRTVPPEGMTIPIDAGRHDVVVIVGGIERLIELVVLPGAEVMLQ